MLEIENLYASYGEGDILKGVSLHVATGELVTLLGRNGVGKTTMIYGIMGLLPHKTGSIIFDGKNILGLTPHEIARLGIGLVPEDRRIFSSLTILENLNLPVTRKRPEGWSVSKIFEYFPSTAIEAETQGISVKRRGAADAGHCQDIENEDLLNPSGRAYRRTCPYAGERD